jgi:hypothetical protein
VEGLPAGLVNVMQAALEALAAAGYPARLSLSSLTDGPQVDETNSLLELHRHALLWSTAAVAALCRSPPVAARVAALQGLPAALTAALRYRELDIHLYAAGGTGGWQLVKR